MGAVRPKLTVFIPVYNGEPYIGAAIDSILAQNFSDYELLLIDDGPADRSLGIVQSRIRVVRNERNLSIPTTRNIGLLVRSYKGSRRPIGKPSAIPNRC